MKQIPLIKSLLILAACGLSLSARAQDATAIDTGLLGKHYAGLDYSYADVNKSPARLSGYGFEYNRPLKAGYDASLGFSYAKSQLIAGSRLKEVTFGAGLTAFKDLSWGKPYASAGLGYTQARYAGLRESSYLLGGDVGVEFAVYSGISLTPYAGYSTAPDLDGGTDAWYYGVTANQWLTKVVALTADISVDEYDTATVSFGIKWHF